MRSGIASVFAAALAAGCGSSALPVDAGQAVEAGPTVAEVGPTVSPDGGADVAMAPPDTGVADTPVAVIPDAAADLPGPVPPPDAQAIDLGQPTRNDAPFTGVVRDLDLLFVIDNSPSMEQEQANLRRNFPALMNALKELPGGLPNLHVGVVSTDLGAGTGVGTGACSRPGGDRGILQTKPACGLAGEARFIMSHNNGTMNNFNGDISTVFSCMADLGIRGCGYEHQLQAARVALYEAITPENMGFLRRDALLGIIVISDEDDCSGETNTDFYSDVSTYPGTTGSFRCAHTGHVCNGATPPMTEFAAPLASCQASEAGRLIKVSEMVDSIRALKARPDQQIVVAGIFGWPLDGQMGTYRYVREREGLDLAPACDSATQGVAYPGLRLKKFVESFGASGSFFSVCDYDFTPALRKIGEKLAGRL
jgi:hypothetical protein